MGRRATGGAFADHRGVVYMRVTVSGERLAERLPWVTPEQWARHGTSTPCPCVACERARLVQSWIAQLQEAERLDVLDPRKLAEGAAATTDPERLAAYARAVAAAVEGRAKPKAPPSGVGERAFRKVSERWTNGELHRLYPDHVREKKSARDDVYRFRVLNRTVLGALDVDRITLEHCDTAMGQLDAVRRQAEAERAKAASRAPRTVPPLDKASRRQYAQLVAKVLRISAYPLRLITASPIPDGWLPRVPVKAKGIPYPDEERAVLGDSAHPIHFRVFYGALARLGFRTDEVAGLTMADVDVERGIVTLDETKTDAPRAPSFGRTPGREWYGPSLMRALKWWRDTYRAGAKPGDPFFVQPNGERFRVDGSAARWQAMLAASMRKAGLERPELFTKTATRIRTRGHDLRGMFTTYALANGMTETWVMDRTGHRSSQMVNRYRQVARTVLEAGLGDLAPLDEAIPEIAAGFAAAVSAEGPKGVDARQASKYRNNASFGPIAQLVELRTFKCESETTPANSRDVATGDEDDGGPTAPALPVPSAGTDDVEAALVAALRVATEALDLEAITLVPAARRARGPARSGNVVDIDEASRRRRGR